MLECVNHSCVLTLSLIDGLFLGVSGRLLGDGLDHGFLDGDDYAIGNLDIDRMLCHLVDFAIDSATEADAVAFLQLFAELRKSYPLVRLELLGKMRI